MKLFRLWQFTLIGITLMILGVTVISPSSFLGSFVGMIGLALFGLPIYYAWRVKIAETTGRKS